MRDVTDFSWQRCTADNGVIENQNGEKTDIKSLPLEQLEQWAVEHGEKKFRAKQLYQWMHVKLVEDPEQMSNLSAAFGRRSGKLHFYSIETGDDAGICPGRNPQIPV